MHPGELFRKALLEEKPFQIVGVINAFTALMAEKAGFKALYLSGAGVANAAYGLPDLGMTSLDNILEEARRILSAVSLPLLVDIDTGWGSSLNIARAIKLLSSAGVAAIHIEDQIFPKRCGHRPGKKLISSHEMVERIQAAVNARTDPSFVIIARCDAFATEGLEGVIQRGIAYRQAGADMLFPEALHTLEEYQKVKEQVGIPLLANLTEFGVSPLFTVKELAEANVDAALYPLSLMRIMNLAAAKALQEIRVQGTQKCLLQEMQTREELYGFLHYYEEEAKLK